MYYLLTFIGGLFIGSFLNLVSDRVIRGESILFGRSHCENCKKELAPKDLVPLLSFLSIKGKCRYCGTKLSFYYPLAELLTGLAFAGSAFYLNLFTDLTTNKLITFIYLIIVSSIYIVLLLTDLKYRLLPDKITFFGIIFVFLFIVSNMAIALVTAYRILNADEFGKYLIEAGFWNSQLFSSFKALGLLVGSSLLISLFFWFLVFITRGRGMGGGDIKLGLLIGLFNGFPYNFLAIFLGFFIGSIYSLIIVGLRLKTVKDTIPFGPFLIAGSIAAFLWGPQITSWYFNLF